MTLSGDCMIHAGFPPLPTRPTQTRDTLYPFPLPSSPGPSSPGSMFDLRSSLVDPTPAFLGKLSQFPFSFSNPPPFPCLASACTISLLCWLMVFPPRDGDSTCLSRFMKTHLGVWPRSEDLCRGALKPQHGAHGGGLFVRNSQSATANRVFRFRSSRDTARPRTCANPACGR